MGNPRRSRIALSSMPAAWLVAGMLCVAGWSRAQTAQPDKSDESAIRISFANLKQAIERGDRDAVISRLSPTTLELFSRAREFALNPDGANAESLSQFEVLVGFHALWLVGTNVLKSKSVSDLFEFSVQNGIVQIGALAAVDLQDFKIESDAATACMATKSQVLTNAVLSFARQRGIWKLELDKFLLAAEPQLAAVRAESGFSKTELAVLLLEQMAGQQIPALREYTLSPGTRKRVAELKGADAARVYQGVLSELGAGRQGDAEDMLEIFVGTYTNDQRLAFAQAVCSRSRWSKRKAEWQFKRVLDLAPATPEGNCARYMLELAARRNVKENMHALRMVSDRNPDNPLMLWLLAIECREDHKLTGETTYSQEAVRCYRRMLKIFDVGPVLLHQTFANVLAEELGLLDEGLKHRRIAVQLEPKSWTYQGLANTLSAMKKYDEANKAFAKVVELDPNDAQYWISWVYSLFQQKQYDDCIEKSKMALKADPANFNAYRMWGRCLEEQWKHIAALEKFQKALALNPADRDASDGCIRMLEKQGRNEEARKMREQRDGVPVRRPIAASTNLTDTARAEAVAKLNGADAQALSAFFGQPLTNGTQSGDITVYLLKSWHDWDEIALRMKQDKGLVAIIAWKYKGGHATLAEWREALRRDFGIRLGGIRMTKHAYASGTEYYNVLCQGRPPGVKSIGLRVGTSAVTDPKGATLSALKEAKVVSAPFFIEY